MTILAWDLGTSSLKASLVDVDRGCVTDAVSVPCTTVYGEGGAAEQDSSQWWDHAVRATRLLLERNPRTMPCAIGVGAHMLGCLPVDDEGRALAFSMIHEDTRAVKECRQLVSQVGADALYRLTGNVPDARAGLCKILWIRENRPELYRQTARFLQAKDFLVSRLTGRMDVTDDSDAAHSLLLNISTRQTPADRLQKWGIDVQKLPSPGPAVRPVGAVSARAAELTGLPEGTPVTAGGGDGICASAAAGAVRSGEGYLALGTTAWISYHSPVPVLDDRRRIFNLPAADAGGFEIIGTVQSACRCVDWACRLLGFSDAAELTAAADTVLPGSNGLLFLPYLQGERCPVYHADASGLFFGITAAHTGAHFARAVLEGVSLALRQVLEVHRESRPFDELKLFGGGARSSVWRQILANVLNVRLKRLPMPEADATSVGAALIASVGCGLYPSIGDAAAVLPAACDETLPQSDLRGVCDDLYARYLRLYPSVCGLYPPRD